MTAGPVDRTVSVRAGLFETRVREAGAGSPLLYLHGAEGPLPGWPPFLESLAERFRVVASSRRTCRASGSRAAASASPTSWT